MEAEKKKKKKSVSVVVAETRLKHQHKLLNSVWLLLTAEAVSQVLKSRIAPQKTER